MNLQPLAPGEVSSGSPSLTMTMSRASRARSCSMTDAILRYVPLSCVATCAPRGIKASAAVSSTLRL